MKRSSSGKSKLKTKSKELTALAHAPRFQDPQISGRGSDQECEGSGAAAAACRGPEAKTDSEVVFLSANVSAWDNAAPDERAREGRERAAYGRDDVFERVPGAQFIQGDREVREVAMYDFAATTCSCFLMMLAVCAIAFGGDFSSRTDKLKFRDAAGQRSIRSSSKTTQAPSSWTGKWKGTRPPED